MTEPTTAAKSKPPCPMHGCKIPEHQRPATAAVLAVECGYCEGHGYTIQGSKAVECDRCRGTGIVRA